MCVWFALCVFVAVVTFFVTLQSATKLIRTQYFIRISKERETASERAQRASEFAAKRAPTQARERNHTEHRLCACVFVCVSADFDSKQKSAENFISAPLFVMFSLQLYACVCVCVRERVCVCVRCCFILALARWSAATAHWRFSRHVQLRFADADNNWTHTRLSASLSVCLSLYLSSSLSL